MIALKRRAFLLASAAAVFIPGMPCATPTALKARAGGKSTDAGVFPLTQDGEWLANFSLERDGKVMESKMGSVRQHGGTMTIQAPEGLKNAQAGDVYIITYTGMRLS